MLTNCPLRIAFQYSGLPNPSYGVRLITLNLVREDTNHGKGVYSKHHKKNANKLPAQDCFFNLVDCIILHMCS